MYITHERIEPELFRQSPLPDCGAQVTFEGIVRNHNQGRSVKRIYYECYEPMANTVIADIITEVKKLTSVNDIRVTHRVGWLEVGDIAVMVVVNSSHRAASFEACQMIIDLLKKDVPIWKKEEFSDGRHEWLGEHAGTVHDTEKTHI